MRDLLVGNRKAIVSDRNRLEPTFSPAARVSVFNNLNIMPVQMADFPARSITDDDPGVYIVFYDAAVAQFVRAANITPNLPPHRVLLLTQPNLLTSDIFKEEVRVSRQ